MMIQKIDLEQIEYLNEKDLNVRKQLGQFFTNSTISDYMASNLEIKNFSGTLRLLDAGAGVGILSCSAALHCLQNGHKSVHAVLYELDKEALPALNINLNNIKKHFKENNATFTFEVRGEDFVLSRPDKNEAPFHISSINPPYFKYNTKTSVYSGATSDLFKGNPNIYASFMAVASECLVPGGQMVAIIPRSFTNGLYFKGFRNYLYENMSLERIHIFNSRKKVFKKLDVLQENVICKYQKSKQSKSIEIRSSTCSSDIESSEVNSYPLSLIIDSTDAQNLIRIPENSEEGDILRRVEHWPKTFNELNYFISTGPVVEHRTRNFITSSSSSKKSVPLLRMHNINSYYTEWTGDHCKDSRFKILAGHEKHLVPNKIYIVLKRFSSKDEKKRLVAAVHDPNKITGDLIGIENHLNYIGLLDQGMDLIEANGLATLLNSTFMDKYFRCISGNTQVNATEMRIIKLPEKDKIISIGNEIVNLQEPNQILIDEIVDRHI
jgi:adenine-specific DNA-methyltransferase